MPVSDGGRRGRDAAARHRSGGCGEPARGRRAAGGAQADGAALRAASFFGSGGGRAPATGGAGQAASATAARVAVARALEWGGERRRPPCEHVCVDGEVDGAHYGFVDDARFDEMVQRGELLEWALVHRTARYGTPRGPVEEALAAGRLALPESGPA